MNSFLGKTLAVGALTLLVASSAMAATGGGKTGGVTSKTLEYRDKVIQVQNNYNDIYQTTVNAKARVFYNPAYGGGEATEFRKVWDELCFDSNPYSSEVLAAVDCYKAQVSDWLQADNTGGRGVIAQDPSPVVTLTEETPVSTLTGSTEVLTNEELTNVQTTELIGENTFAIGDSQYGNAENLYIAAGDTVLLTEAWITETWLQTNNFDRLNSADWTVTGHKVISPLVLSLNGKETIEASGGQWLPHGKQFNTKHKALFDFYGNGFPVAMEWVGPNDGLLCQPKKNGNVDGSCLFGTATGYRNGYEQLSVKDSNRDGKVTGSELNGLYVWQDKNGNAVADAGELKAVQEMGITSIAVMHKDYKSSFVMNGKKTAMFDWWPTSFELKKVKSKKA
jgi:hypothetical protein